MSATETSIEQLIQIVSAASADATARSGNWLACRPGCSHCCHGVFAISALDADRIRKGLNDLALLEPSRARKVVERASESVNRLASSFPGDQNTGHLFDTPEAELAFEEFGNDEPCPALDPATQTCDLYTSRPILCRTFGLPLQAEDAGLAVCELCFEGAPGEEIERCQIDPKINAVEAAANADYEHAIGERYQTTVAFALYAGGPAIEAFSPARS